LPSPGSEFLYNDIAPMIAIGLLEYASDRSAFDFAEKELFSPMGFRNNEWMHQDGSGSDMGGYGLRVRPIDMQKFGVLYLNHGKWNGKQILSEEWVKRSFSPWIKANPKLVYPNYGWYFWGSAFSHGLKSHTAAGWKGQRIDIFPDKGLVITMTACVEDDTEGALFDQMMNTFIGAAVHDQPLPPSPTGDAQLAASLREVLQKQRISSQVEARMIPSTAAKEKRKPFRLSGLRP
jgi:CubicO group peptidase (beta-lactamase class C family)